MRKIFGNLDVGLGSLPGFRFTLPSMKPPLYTGFSACVSKPTYSLAPEQQGGLHCLLCIPMLVYL